MATNSKLIEPIMVESCGLPCEEVAIEIVERKGLGHPDTICDVVMESVSVALAQTYLKTCGHLLSSLAIQICLEISKTSTFPHDKGFFQWDQCIRMEWHDPWRKVMSGTV